MSQTALLRLRGRPLGLSAVLRGSRACPLGMRSMAAAASLAEASAAHVKRAKRLEPLLKVAASQGLIPPSTAPGPCADFYDLDALDARVKELTTAFHEPFFTHCLAVKAQPIRGILQRVVAAGCGLECASICEVVHSRSLAAPTVIFDSPCKSRDEMRDVLLNMPNVYMNLDNEQEIADVDAIVKENPGVDFTGRIGLRINPVTGAGSIASVSTASRGSKFGLPLVPESEAQLLGLYKDHAWLQGVHIHVGSQGISMDMLQVGARTLMKFVKDVESLRGDGTIKVLDIGGGLPTSYVEDEEAHTFASYRTALESAVPEIFTGKYRILTEFGRCVFTKPCVTTSRVAVVKGAPWHPETPLAIVHVGSNQFVREAYLGEQWRHRFTAFNPDGTVQNSTEKDVRMFDIAGPLCFQGDYIGRQHCLPSSLGPNDIMVMHDTGGYTMAMYSKYNSRQASPVYGYRKSADGFSFTVLKERETYEETLAFWGPEEQRSLK